MTRLVTHNQRYELLLHQQPLPHVPDVEHTWKDGRVACKKSGTVCASDRLGYGRGSSSRRFFKRDVCLACLWKYFTGGFLCSSFSDVIIVALAHHVCWWYYQKPSPKCGCGWTLESKLNYIMMSRECWITWETWLSCRGINCHPFTFLCHNNGTFLYVGKLVSLFKIVANAHFQSM